MGNRDDSSMRIYDYLEKIIFLHEQKAKIESGDLNPVLTTFLYQLKHFESGGNLATYIPLVRTKDYAGKCRRKKIYESVSARSSTHVEAVGRRASN